MDPLRRGPKGRLFLVFLLVALFFVRAGTSLAGGWDFGMIGPRAPGMGTAFTGLADDPSAIFYNPAGLALLEDKQGFSLTVRYNLATLEYSFPEGRLSPEGKDKGSSSLTGIVPDIFYYRQFGTIAAGIGIYVPYGGLSGSWAPDTFGVDMNQLMAVASITPSLAWAITPKLSVGAGLNIYFGFIKSKVRMDQIPLAMFLPDHPVLDRVKYVPLRLEQDFYAKGFAFGYNVGVLYKPIKQLSFGIALRSGSDVTLEGPADIVVPLQDPLAIYLRSDLEIKYKLPYLVNAGIAFRPSPKLVLLADVQYNGWGRLEDIRFTFKSLNFTQVNRTGFEDTVKFMLGLEYVFLEHCSVRLGYMYMPSNIKDSKDYSYQSWDLDLHGVSVGLGYSWKRFSIHSIAMLFPAEAVVKHEDDPGDPIGKPAGEYGGFNQMYGAGCIWYF
jgi:long-chain fatty acid transport protein